MHYPVVRTALVVALLLISVSPLLAQDGPTPVSPFPRGLSGTLAFQSDKRTATNPNSRVKIYTIELSTGRVAALTPQGDWHDEQPRWSPDGQRIAFKSTRGGSYNLYVMDADGRNVRRLTEHAGNDHDPAWLPDGQSMVFTSDRDRGRGRFDLYRLWLADGSIERLTTSFEGFAFMPSVSPDGNWVAFVATTFPVVDGWTNQVHVLELATRQTWPFNTTAAGCWPNWSPDGQSITHVSLINEPSVIQTINSFGEAPEPVPGEAGRWHYYPDWSPDNRLLAISSSPEHHDGENWDLAILDPTRATPVRRLTTGAGNDRLPDWKPR
jgi:Tol biopolymer transport system component